MRSNLAHTVGAFAAALAIASTAGCGVDLTNDGTDNADVVDGVVTGQYDPAEGLELESGSLSITIPAGAADAAVTISMRPIGPNDPPNGVPEGIGIVGGVFAPDGQTFTTPARVSLRLGTQTIARALPVLTYDTASDRWVSAETNAVVAGNGVDVGFSLDHFSMFGLPDPVPMPEAGDPIGSFVVISADGQFSSDEISSPTSSLTYSEFGDTFSISVTAPGGVGSDTAMLGLTAQTVSEVGNFVVGTFAGGRSIFNAGGFNEPAYGVMIMSVSGSSVTVSVFAATPERVICGTLTGQSL